MYKLILLKRRIENLFIFPFILLGRLIASFNPHPKEFRIFFIFPFYHTGGAEKLHYQIARATGGPDCVIYFTRKSVSSSFLDEFRKTGAVIRDISRYTDNKLIFPVNLVFRGLVSTFINRQRSRPVVFNGQSNFGYKISPWIRKEIVQIDLIHALNSFSSIRIPFLEFYRNSITVSDEIVAKHRQSYLRLAVPESLLGRFRVIPSRIELPLKVRPKDYRGPLIVLYVGRGTHEKRVHLVASIAKEIIESGVKMSFRFLGDVKGSIPSALHPFCEFLEDQSDPVIIEEIYQEAHIMMITSTTESGPLVLMEGMARGLVAIATPVGFVPVHVRSGVEGFVFSGINDDDDIVKEGKRYLLELNNDRPMLERISQHNIQYAHSNFGIDKFAAAYQELFESVKEPA